MADNEANLKSHEHKTVRSLSSEVPEECNNKESDEIDNKEMEASLQQHTDEGDGLRTKIKVLTYVVRKKTAKNKTKEEIEPYTMVSGSWTYSKYTSGVDQTKIKSEKTVLPTSNINKNSSSQPCTVSETAILTQNNCYNFTNKKTGYLLLVINQKFYNQASRIGADLDLLKMKAVAKKFGFETLNKGTETNLTQSETMAWVQKARDTDHSSCDCFMFMISTHGLEQPNPNKGGLIDHALVCADDKLIFTSTIIEMFSDANCPSLKGKPKIFIIQACRGTSVDHGSDVTISTSKGKPRSAVRDKKAQPDHSTDIRSDMSDTKASPDSWAEDIPRDTETPCLKCHADMLVMYAIPPGMLAWRNTADGSWMIHYLHEIMMAYDLKAPKSLLNVLTKVSARMANRATDTPSVPEFHEKKAIPVIEHMLTRDVLFSLKV